MKIYTKKGDRGETSLLGGARVSKAHLRIKTYGTFDEVNALLGLVLTEEDIPELIRKRLERIQNELFQLGAELATPEGKKSQCPLLDQRHVEQMEKEVDEMQSELPELNHFVLPGGKRGAALVHLVRTVARRGEIWVVMLHQTEPLRPVVLQYVNRMSDYLFVVARYVNFCAGEKDVPWVAKDAH